MTSTSTSAKKGSVKPGLAYASPFVFLYKVFLICALAFFVYPALARNEAENNFSEGMKAAKKGDFDNAIEYFRHARRLGKSSDALLYNLGVCFYRLNDFEAAITWFELLLRSEKNRGLALYNLGLAHARLDENVKAIRWFKRVLESDADKKLKALAARQIKTIYATQKTSLVEHREKRSKRAAKHWYAGAGVDLGWDDNIIYPDSTQSSDKGDAYSKYLAWARARVIGDNKLGVQARVLGFGTDFQNASDYDRHVVRVSINPYWRWNKWTYELGLGHEFSLLGSQDYLGTDKFYVSARKSIKRGSSVVLKFGYDEIKDNSPGDYSYLEGDRQYLSFNYYNSQGSFRYKINYDVEKNRRADRTINQYFISYSPLRQNLGILWEQTWASRFTTRQGVGYRFSQFRDANTFQNDSDDEEKKRRDEKVSLQVGLGLLLSQKISVDLDYITNVSDSNIAFYDYEQSLLNLGINIKF